MTERGKNLSVSRVDMLYPPNERPTFESHVVGSVSIGNEPPSPIRPIQGAAPTDEEVVASITDIANYPSRFTDFTGKITVLPISRDNPWANGSNIRRLLFREQS